MDPAMIVGLIDASISLALKCASTIKTMNDIGSRYKNSKLTVMSITGNLDAMQFAWDKIAAWTQSYTPGGSSDDDNFVLRMARFLETGTLVMDALEEELLPYSDADLGFAQRVKLVWNGMTFADHQNRIRDQATSMSLLLQAIQLPTPQARGKLIKKSKSQFQKSDESAYSIVPSRMSSRISISTHQTDSRQSIRNEEDIVYRRLSFEDDLFTARVYKRNYRNPLLLQLWENKPHKPSGVTKLADTAQLAKRGLSHDDGPESLADLSQEATLDGSAQNGHLQLDADSQHRGTAPQSDHMSEERRPGNIKRLSADYWASTAHIEDTKNQFTNLDPVVTEMTDKQAMLSAGPQIGQHACSLNTELSEELMRACEQGDYSTVQKFLRTSHGMHSVQTYRDRLGFKPIHAAVMYGYIELTHLLLRHGASVEDETTAFGSRPLHLAAQSGQASMVRVLLTHGAVIGAKDKVGEQPIHLAAQSGSVEILHILVDNGAELDCSDKNGRQPLHCAAESSDRPDVIQFLVKAGADVNAVTLYGRPLNVACRRNLPENVRALLALGAAYNGGYFSYSRPVKTAIIEGSLAPLEALGNILHL